jgi:hypothetical protein
MNITITKSPRLKIHCNSLIIKYQSVANNINELKYFQSKLQCNLLTNQELIITHDMMVPSEKFYEIIDEVFNPMNLTEGQDFIIAEEQMIYGAGNRITPLINQEHPELINVPWIDSEITFDGNLVWLRESNIMKSELDNNYWIDLIHQLQKIRGDYLAGRPIKIIEDLGEKFQIHQDGVKNGRLYVSKDYLRHFFDENI